MQSISFFLLGNQLNVYPAIMINQRGIGLYLKATVLLGKAGWQRIEIPAGDILTLQFRRGSLLKGLFYPPLQAVF